MLKYSLFALAIIGIVFSLILMREMSKDSPPLAVPQPPAKNPYEAAIAASGIVEAAQENIFIGVPQAAILQKLYFNVGDYVKENDPLFKLDSRDLDAELAVQKANIEVQESNVVRLKDQLERLKSVKDLRAVSREEVKTKENDVKIAEAQLEKSKAEAEKTQIMIDRLTVRAPRDGIILQNHVRVGEYVSLASTVPVMILGNVDKLQVRVDIDEQNASLFKPEMKAVAFPKNNTELSIPLTFVRVEPFVIPKKSLTGFSEERVDTRVLQVIYRFEKPKDFSIYVGQQVDVFIEKK